MEDRGEVRGGRFVSGVWGEQFALPNAIPLLRAQQKEQGAPIANGRREVRSSPLLGIGAGGEGGFVVLSAADPLNLTGVITTGERVATRHTDRILYRDGVPVAVYDGDELRWLQSPRQDLDAHREAELMKQRMRRQVPERLRVFYGKGIG
jgi:ATP-dependent Lhr-like helicase